MESEAAGVSGVGAQSDTLKISLASSLVAATFLCLRALKRHSQQVVFLDLRGRGGGQASSSQNQTSRLKQPQR